MTAKQLVDLVKLKMQAGQETFDKSDILDLFTYVGELEYKVNRMSCGYYEDCEDNEVLTCPAKSYSIDYIRRMQREYNGG